MARYSRSRTTRSARGSRRSNGRSTTRRTSRVRRAAPRRASRARGRSTAPRQQRLVIEFAGASPVRDAVEGLGVQYKPAGPVRVKPRL